MEERSVINQPAVSIIVPVYNTGRYIRQCVDSLLAQTLEYIEIILVDDESPDDAPGICDAYAERDSRVRVIHQTNRGLGLSRNSGLQIARGKYIGFVDSDDFVSTEMYQLLYDNAARNDADISYCTFQRFSSLEQIKDYKAENHPIKKYQGAEIHQYLLDRIGLPPQSKSDKLCGVSVWGGIFLKTTLDRIGAQFVSEREIISEDMIFDIDVIPQCKTIVHQDVPLYYYRYNNTSLTTSYKPDRFLKNIELCHEMHRRLQNWYSEDELFNPIARYLLTTARIAIIQEMTFSRQHGYQETVGNIKAICDDAEIQDILNSYEYKALPLKYRLTCSLMRNRNARLLYALYWKYRR